MSVGSVNSNVTFGQQQPVKKVMLNALLHILGPVSAQRQLLLVR